LGLHLESDGTEPLNVERNQIRLLSLLAGPPELPIQCALHTVSLDSKPRYETLFYAWGSPKSKLPIFLSDRTIKVTVNLEVSLRHIRVEHEARVYR
jgi:hypothetical protein